MNAILKVAPLAQPAHFPTAPMAALKSLVVQYANMYSLLVMSIVDAKDVVQPAIRTMAI